MKMLHDGIVCGMQDEIMQMKFQAESQLTLNRATEIMVTMKKVAGDASNLLISSNSEVNSQRKVLVICQKIEIHKL